eukprot:CAMPEP_0177720204 /NCGR_PEP_ID=MMETSP0484_2-20121128/16507_1 /TAXON_ID=354590 /ORGANISM="Rhodomonas lens, Strain RHODO" /LENGTH=199 /DNA_ID=CAMNT_0019232463 /DNA_START=123 /DNA_END=718 /DNA_ORIENTATION=-
MSEQQLQGHEVFVTTEAGGSNIGIALVGPHHAVPLVSMNPSCAASLEQTLLRLAQKFQKCGIKASTLALTQTAPNSPAIDAAKADNSEWTTGKKVLMVDSEPIPVVLNPPACKTIQLPRRWIVGCALRPRVELAGAQEELCSIKWLRASTDDADDQDGAVVGEGWEYTPCEADIGYRLVVEVVPARTQHAEEEEETAGG